MILSIKIIINIFIFIYLMEVIGGGLKITIQNTLKRLGSILIWLL